MSARSITALRTLRPALVASSRPFTTTLPARVSAFGGKEDIGGPGGQQPPPPNPGGPEALRRNWMLIGGAALAVLVGYNWIAKNPDEARQQRDKTLGEMSGRKKTEMGGFRND
ncbi:hypothetical protein J3F83DRAFT_295236 [Trichoderma novae-zelandiae]